MTATERQLLERLANDLRDGLSRARGSAKDSGYPYAFGCASAWLEFAAERLDQVLRLQAGRDKDAA